ncbi:MAG TPA: helix-turn-helix domain-containing protein, partial [Chthoniobacteraceae bacterium]|nr:helix-turn-helix domain-containing protein [Chthoniobacteraceae bacterium]
MSLDLTAQDLATPDGGQPFLFSQSTLDAITAEEERGHYTLERLRERRPEAMQEIMRLLAAGVSQRRIAMLVKVAPETVAAVLLKEPAAIRAVSERLAGKYKLAADLLVDRILENPGVVPGNAIALAIGQLTDKAQLLSGAATMRVESVKVEGNP